MFARIGRIISAFFNRFLGSVEEPTMILENNIRELQGQVPRLNESVARSHGAVIMLQKQLGKYIEDIAVLDSQVKAALKLGNEDAARDIVVKLQELKDKEVKTGKDLELSQANLSQVQETRDHTVKEIKSKVEEIRGAIEENRFSEMQKQIAETISPDTSIDINSTTNSTNEMLTRLQQETAINQGAFAAALSNKAPELQSARIEKEAKQMRADDLLSQYKDKMNLTTKSVSKASDATDVEIVFK